MTKKQRGFKKPRPKFFYKADIFLSRMASVLKIPQSKVKELLFQSNLYAVKVLDKTNLEFAKKVEWSKNTYLITREEYVNLKKTKEYSQGYFLIQNLSEMIPVISLNPKANDTVLDMYAGEATLHLAILMKNQGEIFANVEHSPEQIGSLLGRHNIKNVEINISKGEDIEDDFKGKFDKVLLNSPCSREGIVHFSQKRPLKSWSIQKTKALSKLQKKLILVAFDCLKKGGKLAYFTTTISPNENEEVVSSLLENRGDASLEDISLIQEKSFQSYSPFVKKGLKSWNNEVFHSDITKTIRTIPGKTMFGTYLAIIRKA